MRRDHQLFSLAEINPGYDLDAKVLLVRYCIGDDQDPDEVIDIQAKGDFRIDAKLRDEIRAILLDSTDDLSADDLYVREAKMPPQGTGMGYLIELWVQALPSNIVGGLITAGIVAGWVKLRRKYPRKALPAQPVPAQPAPAPIQSVPVRSPDELRVGSVKHLVHQHYATQQRLMTFTFFITEWHSDTDFDCTVELREQGGRTFHVTDQRAPGWQLTHIFRKHPQT